MSEAVEPRRAGTYIKTDVTPEDVLVWHREGEDGDDHQALRYRAVEQARRVWGTIGSTPVQLACSWQGTVHVLRMEPRGYGKKKLRWRETTECGQIAEPTHGWSVQAGRLEDTACLTCRKLVHERYEHDRVYLSAEQLATKYGPERLQPVPLLGRTQEARSFLARYRIADNEAATAQYRAEFDVAVRAELVRLQRYACHLADCYGDVDEGRKCTCGLRQIRNYVRDGEIQA
jgi:hypothetical protein